MIQPTKHLKFRKKDQSVGASILHRKENKVIMGDKGKEGPGRQRRERERERERENENRLRYEKIQ